MTHILEIVRNRTDQITPISTTIRKEGERAVDQCEIILTKNTSMNINDRIEILFDIISVENLALIYNFQGGVNDESINQNNGTATDVTYQSEPDFYGLEAVFNGTSSGVSVPSDATLDFTGDFDIFVWLKWSSTTNQYILTKRTSVNNGWSLSVNDTTAGDVRFQLGPVEIISSSSGFNDGNKHLVRVSRNSNNVINMYIDDVFEGTITSTYVPSTATPLLIGRTNAGDYFNGSIMRLRLYNAIKDTKEVTTLYTKPNPRTTLKFGGFVTKIDLELSGKKVTAQSYGKSLAETDIRGEYFQSSTVENIVQTLVENNTDFTFNDRGIPTGVSINNFVADGKLIDLVQDFAAFTGRIFYTTSAQEFFFEPANFNDTNKTFVHGSDAIIAKSAFDDSKLINSVTVIGEKTEYTTQETFSGNSSDTVFTLLYSGTKSIKVTVGGVEQDPEGVDYSLDSVRKEITFVSPPATGTNNIVVDYTYEKPLVIKGEKPASITQYGVHAKTFNMGWINTREDGVRFISSYLNKYSEVNQNISLKFGIPVLYLNENDLIYAKNTFLGIDDGFAIKSIEWTYPELNTVITVGEYRFDYFENDKEIVRKLHDYESSLTSNKEILDYESPEEIISLTDDVFILLVEDATETLNITDTKNVYDKTVATYGSSSYGSRVSGGIYGT